jgi:hypothetical protein
MQGLGVSACFLLECCYLIYMALLANIDWVRAMVGPEKLFECAIACVTCCHVHNIDRGRACLNHHISTPNIACLGHLLNGVVELVLPLPLA